MRGTLTRLSLFSLLGLLAPVHADDEPLPTVGEVRAGTAEWQSQFATIHVKSRSTNIGDVLEGVPELEGDPTIGERYYHTRDFRFSDELLTLQATVAYRDGKVSSRSMTGYGTGVGWVANTIRGAEDQSKFNLMHVGPPAETHPLRTFESYEEFLPLWDGSGLWLSERLEKADFSVKRRDEVDGHDCILVEFVKTQELGYKTVEKLWLDPQSGWLPRRMERLFANPESPTPGTPMTWSAIELLQYGDAFWFPTKGTMTSSPQHSPFEWEIMELSLNEPMPRSLFVPLKQPGLKVMDKVKGEVYVLDSNGRPFRRPKKPNVKKSVVSPAGDGTQAIAESFPWSLVVGGLGVAVVALAAFVKWRTTRV